MDIFSYQRSAPASLLAFEWKQTAQCNIKVGQGYRNRRITHCLSDIGRPGKRQADIGKTT